MTPPARAAAAAALLDEILAGRPAEAALTGWARASRFAGSGDRAAVRDLVYDALRRRESLAALGGALTGRGLILGALRADGRDPAEIFTGARHALAELDAAEREGLLSPPPEDAPPYDIPRWLWPEWQESLGDQAGDIARAMRARAPVWLRVNLRKADPKRAIAALSEDGITAEPAPALPSALRVTEGERRVAASRAYQQGLVELQDLSAQLACAAVPVADGQKMLDFCAGGGGKTLALGARASLDLTAHDAAPRRMADLPSRATRAGLRVTLCPPAPLGQSYDLVVADVPCSGSGTWRRTPDAKWRLTPEELDSLTKIQAAILDDAARLTAPGGTLAYMTCSVLTRENEAQIAAFLVRNPGWRAGEAQRWTPLNASDGFFLTILHKDQAR
ncbi:MAG: RsmB/NOP family class I SAM-dependent RNA methyltransferase [Paracoccus sp. (in: a-proteobacteria)]|nr:RsmB/NOP family class I SAM-dependent RNA methyltransferase [Paracoccus sp. (in: a-proteobacteria)]